MERLVDIGQTKNDNENYEITVSYNKENSTLTISDNGIGMTEEVKEYISQVAFSGAVDFLGNIKKQPIKTVLLVISVWFLFCIYGV